MATQTPATAAAAPTPALTDAQKLLLRDKQLRFVVAQANLNQLQSQAQSVQTQIQNTQQTLTNARQEFQTALDTVVAELGIDGTAYQLDLDALAFVPKPAAQQAVPAATPAA